MSAATIRITAIRPIIGIIFGLLAGIAVAAARNASPKEYAPALGGIVFLVIITAWKYGEQFCLFSFLMAVPLPMHAFFLKLDPLHGGGALGLYALAPDAVLAVLMIFWFLDWAKGRQVPKRSSGLPLLMIPFLLIGLISMVYAEKPMWAFCEWVRWAKVFIILLYAVYRLRGPAVDVALLSMGFSVILEGGISAAQAAMRSNLGLDKLGIFGASGEQSVTQEVQSGTLFRGSALTGHPNYLAGYLLLLVPIFGLLALSEPVRWRKIVWATAFLAGAGGLAATMSRAAIAAFGAACLIALVAGIVYKLTTVRRAALIVAAGLAIVGGVALKYQDVIRERIKADWDSSWELRKHLNSSAIDIAEDNVVLGVGLNNFTVAYPTYNPEFAAKLIEMENMITAVHNLYLLVWAEVGTVGLASFLLFLLGCVVAAWRSLEGLDWQGRSVMLGLACGLIAAMANDLTEFVLWVEINMYTLAFVIGMLPALRERAMANRRGLMA